LRFSVRKLGFTRDSMGDCPANHLIVCLAETALQLDQLL
jgi:hypothetical protein